MFYGDIVFRYTIAFKFFNGSSKKFIGDMVVPFCADDSETHF